MFFSYCKYSSIFLLSFALQLCSTFYYCNDVRCFFCVSHLATVFNCSQYGHVVEQHFLPLLVPFLLSQKSNGLNKNDEERRQEPCSLAISRNCKKMHERRKATTRWKWNGHIENATFVVLSTFDGNRAIKFKFWFIYSLWCSFCVRFWCRAIMNEFGFSR